MTTNRPRIAVAHCYFHADPQRAIFKGKTLLYTEQKMARSLWRAGGLPIGHLDIPEAPDEGLRELLSGMDGLLLQGGSDVAPQSYDEEPLQPQWAGDPIRDEYERRCVTIATAMGLPVLGICRGLQILNVALGGTLYQDVETQHPGSLTHRDWDRYEDVEHEVHLAEDTWVRSVYGRATVLTNTVHHQAIKDPAPGLLPTAWAPDGIIEAVEDVKGDRWVAGVQWHPEWLDGSEVGGPHRCEGDSLFRSFIDVCRQRLR